MADVVEQVRVAAEKADRIWKEVYGEKGDKKGDERAREPEATKSEIEPEDNYIPAMAFQLGEQSKKITELEGKISELSGKKEEKKPEETPVENEKISLLKEEYPEVAEGVQEIVKSIADDFKKLHAEVSTKIQKVDQDVEKVTKETARTKKESFLASLDADKEIGSQWRTINQDSEFIDSLQEVEPYSGRTRHELLMDAFNGMDTERTARFFRDFRKDKAAAKKTNDGPTVTRQDIKRFYEDVRAGRWDGREEEASAEEIRLIEGLGIRVKR